MSGDPDAPCEVRTDLDFAAARSEEGPPSSGGCAACASGVVGVRGSAKDVRASFETEETARDGCFHVDEGAGVLEEANDSRGGGCGPTDVTGKANGGIVASNINGIYKVY